MIRTWLETGPIVLGTLTEPATEGADRMRWQLTVRDYRDHAVLDRKQAIELMDALALSLDYVPLLRSSLRGLSE